MIDFLQNVLLCNQQTNSYHKHIRQYFPDWRRFNNRQNMMLQLLMVFQYPCHIFITFYLSFLVILPRAESDKDSTVANNNAKLRLCDWQTVTRVVVTSTCKTVPVLLYWHWPG